MSAERLRWNPTANPDSAAPRCENCGGHITQQFARVFGDNADTVNGCPNCATYRDLKNGARDTETNP